MRASSQSPGFTLIEVMVALVLAALVAATAYAIVALCIEGRTKVEQHRHSLDRVRNGQRLLAALIGSIDVGLPSGGFDGSSDRMAFDAWDLSAHGWLERSRIVLRLDRGRVVLDRAGQPSVMLAENVAELNVDYLLEYGAEAPWLSTWRSPVSAPLAIRVRVAHFGDSGARAVDTSLYLVKSRG